jgi:hypothetical protein
MLPDNLEQLKKSKWLSITIQSSLLGINFLLISQRVVNSFILLSIGLIFSLFLLQSTSHRYLYFKPYNYHVQVPTPHLDTFILYTFTYLSGIFLLLGVACEYNIEVLKKFDSNLKNNVLWIFGILILLLPLCSMIFGRKIIKKCLTNKLKAKKFQYKKKCDECGKDNAIFEHIVVDWDDLRIRKTCQFCGNGKTKEYKTNLYIG